MPLLVADGAMVAFEPDAGWAWHGWNGELPLSVPSAPITAGGLAVAVAADLMQMGQQLVGRPYTATEFDATPGTVANAQVIINQASLSQVVDQEGQACVTESSSGTFRVSCGPPAMGKGSPPPPDPAASGRTGRWTVTSAGQSVATG
jgi:hypothetical protein